MSSVSSSRARHTPAAKSNITPMFVCPGLLLEPLGYASIILGDALEHALQCPRRTQCAWFAGHDLGGDVEFSDFPPAAQILPVFPDGADSPCSHFQRYHGHSVVRIDDPDTEWSLNVDLSELPRLPAHR